MGGDGEPQRSFWREYWPWIVVPAALVVVAVLWLLLSDDGAVTPFRYEGF